MTEYISLLDTSALLAWLKANISSKIVAVYVIGIHQIRIETGILGSNGIGIGNPLSAAELTLLNAWITKLNALFNTVPLSFTLITAENT